MILSAPLTIPQLGFVFQAAAVIGVVKTLAAVERSSRRSRLELGLLARQIGGEVAGEVLRVEEGEAVVGIPDRSRLLLSDAGDASSKGAFILSDIGGMRRDVNEADDARVDAGLP